MAKQKKTEDIKTEVKSDSTVTVSHNVEAQVQPDEKVKEVKMIEEQLKVPLEDFIKTIFKGNKDEHMTEDIEKNIITINIPIISASYWKNLIRGSVFSKMEIHKNENIIKIWVLSDRFEPTLLFKNSLII